MEFATGALGTLLPKLGQLLQGEFNLQKGTKKDMEFLERELKSMHAALHDVGEVPPEELNQVVRVWACDVRELSYDMEDIVDTFLVRVQGPEPPSKRSTKRFFRKMMQKVTKATTHHGIAKEIKDIKERVKEVAERRHRYSIEGVATPTKTMVDPRITALYTKATDIVGIDKAMEELIVRLTEGDDDDVLVRRQMIVSVLGVGGLGKTTLAKAVYDKLKGQFDCRAFVSVSRNPDIQKILKDMLYELDKEEYEDIHRLLLDEKQLIDKVQEFLQNKRYFIIIDDVWAPWSWETIKLALVENSCGSRVIMTTRNFDVAILASEIYRLQPLSYNNSKRLFYRRIFGDDGKYLDKQPDEVSDKILKKCHGIPLAIITMASLLVGKPREMWFELYTAIGFGHKDNIHVENTMKILSFSYYDMPSHLRTCLLYLSVFPEDCVIDKDALICMWIAEGFVHRKQGNGIFEVGEGYFNDLINRSMIQAVDSKVYGIITGCRVHDMVLDLLCSLSHEENFVTILDNNTEGTLLPDPRPVRRLVYQNGTLEHSHQGNHMDMPQARSFIAFRGEFDKRVWLSTFKLLRVLTLEHCTFVEGCFGLEHLGNLNHLRYLGIRYTRIHELTEEIGALKFLHTLDLKETSIEELPRSLGKLTQLVCLRACGVSVPDGITGKLTSLEELQISCPLDNDESMGQFVKDLGNLRELRMLRTSISLMDESMQQGLLQSLGNLQKLQHLTLESFFFSGYTIAWDAAVLSRHLQHLRLPRVYFSMLPSCINPLCLTSLSHLELRVENMDEQGLKILGALVELQYLKLDMSSTVTSTYIAGDGYFQKLRSCVLPSSMIWLVVNEDLSVSMTMWNGGDYIDFGTKKKDNCRVAAAIMPNLQELEFAIYVKALMYYSNGSCGELGLEELPSLQKVKVGFWCESEDMDDDDFASDDVEKELDALGQALEVHPNRPTLEIFCNNGEREMFKEFEELEGW